MHFRALIPFTLVCAAALGADEPASSGGWREALAAEYEATPLAPVAPTMEASPLRPGVPMPEFEDTDPDVVSLPNMTIEARRVPRDLEKGIAEKYRRLKADELNGMAGLLYKKDIGPVRFGVYSILYIPVVINFSW